MGLAPHNVRFLGGPAAVTLLAAEALAVVCCAVAVLGRQVQAESSPATRLLPVGA